MISVISPRLLEDNLSIPRFPAEVLDPQARKALAIKALARTQPLTRLADQNQVSRKFLYQQAAKADNALDAAFSRSTPDDKVLFEYQVTAARLRQVILSLLLNTHGSYQGVQHWLRDVWDREISLGTIHNIVAGVVDQARKINHQEDLSRIRIGAQDEIFQGDPVLVGIDPNSTYCYLLAQEPSRDATTWGYHLLELVQRGFNPDYTVADFGTGLRAGQAEAMPGVPCWGDVFHAEREVGMMVRYLENRALGTISHRDKLQRKMDRAKHRQQGQPLSKKLALSRQEEAQAVSLADDLQLLWQWMKELLALVGPPLAERRELYDFLVSELRAREDRAPHRIRPVRIALENRREALLAFVERIEQGITQIAQKHQVSPQAVRALYELGAIPVEVPGRWQREDELRKQLGAAHFPVRQDLAEFLEHDIVRASSLVENLNSRLRTYFFLRRELGKDYLELLRFFLNHRPYLRSRKEARVGKSPAELLAGNPQPHWLEQLGFTRFRRAA